ncbi:MAG: AMP-binding protein [Solobacterium sp.]|nr:AMP-binding protein [Solobacterium sp.]
MMEYPLLATFDELLTYADEKHCDAVLFRKEDNISFSTFNAQVRQFASSLMTKRELYVVNVKDCRLYAVAVMGIVLSNNIAVLKPGLAKGKMICDHDVVSSFDLPDWDEEFPTNPDDACIIAPSSGTTGFAKGVMLKQRSLLANAYGAVTMSDFPSCGMYFHILPFDHLFGLVGDLLCLLYCGATLDVHHQNNLFRELKNNEITHLNAPPMIVKGILAWRRKHPCSLKHILCGGAYLEPSVIKELKQLSISVTTAYGLTECSPTVSINPDAWNKPYSVGKPFFGSTIRIEKDEILVRSDYLMLGYWQDEKSTAKTIVNGWLHTGDTGRIDEEGYLYITGRKSDLIVFEDGTKLMPEKLERECLQSERISEIRILETDVNGRKLADVIVLAEGNTDAAIKEVFRTNGFISRLHEIRYSDKPFKKTELGKLIRN